MATISGMRRRGYPAKAIRTFCEKIGVSKAYSVVSMDLLESCVRDELNENAPYKPESCNQNYNSPSGNTNGFYGSQQNLSLIHIWSRRSPAQWH